MIETIVNFALKSPFNTGVTLGIILVVAYLWGKFNGAIDKIIKRH